MVLPMETLVNILLCFDTFSCTSRPIIRNTTVEPYSSTYRELVPQTSEYIERSCEPKQTVYYDMLCTCIHPNDVKLFDDAKERIKNGEFTKAPDCQNLQLEMGNLLGDTEQVMLEQELFRKLSSSGAFTQQPFFMPIEPEASNLAAVPQETNMNAPEQTVEPVDHNTHQHLTSQTSMTVANTGPLAPPIVQFHQGDQHSTSSQVNPMRNELTQLQKFTFLISRMNPSQIIEFVRGLPVLDVLEVFREMNPEQRSHLWVLLNDDQSAYLMSNKMGPPTNM